MLGSDHCHLQNQIWMKHDRKEVNPQPITYNTRIFWYSIPSFLALPSASFINYIYKIESAGKIYSKTKTLVTFLEMNISVTGGEKNRWAKHRKDLYFQSAQGWNIMLCRELTEKQDLSNSQSCLYWLLRCTSLIVCLLLEYVRLFQRNTYFQWSFLS